MTIECRETLNVNLANARKSQGIVGKISKLWDRFKAQRALVKQQKIDREAFAHLANLDDTMLKDIGVSRADVIWASKLPLSQNASLELENIARGHRPNS